MAVTAKGTPYVESSDLLANYPGVSLSLANHIDTIAKVLQVVSVTHATDVSTTSESYVTTGLNATITPSLTSSKILILTFVAGVYSTTTGLTTRLTLFRGTVSGTNLAGENGFGTVYSAAGAMVVGGIAMTFLDSPATTSPTTYTAGFKSSTANTSTVQTNENSSTITLMEIGE